MVPQGSERGLTGRLIGFDGTILKRQFQLERESVRQHEFHLRRPFDTLGIGASPYKPSGSVTSSTLLVLRVSGTNPNVFNSASPRLAPRGRARSKTIGSGIRGPFSSPEARSIVGASPSTAEPLRVCSLNSTAFPRISAGGTRRDGPNQSDCQDSGGTMDRNGTGGPIISACVVGLATSPARTIRYTHHLVPGLGGGGGARDRRNKYPGCYAFSWECWCFSNICGISDGRCAPPLSLNAASARSGSTRVDGLYCKRVECGADPLSICS